MMLAQAERFRQTLPAGAAICEIGSERGHGSTATLAAFAKANGWHFVTVDIDPGISAAAREIVQAVDASFEAICSAGETFLAEIDRTFHIVYLDAFDFWHANHPQDRLEAYRDRGTEITDDNAAAMHLACAKSLPRVVPAGGFVCVDDVLSGAPSWKGKGRDAIPWLFEHGFELLEFRRTAALLWKQ